MPRLSIVYSGRVQGVGFRATARAVAADCGVVGWVRNEPDGSVRCVVEGDEDELRGFTDQLASAMSPNIEHATVERSAASGEFARFEIRR